MFSRFLFQTTSGLKMPSWNQLNLFLLGIGQLLYFDLGWVYSATGLNVSVIWEPVRDVCVFVPFFFFAPRINISRCGGSCAAHRRVLCSFDWTQLWWTVQASLRCVYHRSKCCKAVVKGLICLKMSHFVKFVSILRVSYSFNSCRGWLCGTWTAPENCQSK